MVQARATQMMLGLPPNDALIKSSVFAGSTQPRYPEIWAKQTAYNFGQMMIYKRKNSITYDHSSNELWASVVASWHLMVETTDGLWCHSIVMKLDICWCDVLIMRLNRISMGIIRALLLSG